MRSKQIAAFVLAGVLAGAVSITAWTDPCNYFVGEIQALNAKIAATKQQLNNLDDSPQFDTKRAQLEAEIATYQQNLGILQYQYQECQANNPPPSPPPSVDPFVPATGAPDPQLAIGKERIVSIDTSNIVFYHRAADGNIDLSLPPTAMSTYQLFQPLIQRMNLYIGGDTPIFCRNGEGKACIQDAYDTRVFYDSKRDRFWIAAALRPRLWRCDPDNFDNPDPDNLTGYVYDKEKVCHPGHADEVHRYIAVAVTKVAEHPWDFYEWVLVDEYADWPQMTIAKDWLILNHRGEDSDGERNLHFFSANALAGGANDQGILNITGWTFGPDDFNIDAYDWTHDDTVGVTLDTPLSLTTMHGKSDGVAYVVGGYQNYLIVYGFKAPPGNPMGKPIMLTPAAVNLGSGRWVFGANNAPVWRHGRLYYAYETCESDDCSVDPRMFLRLLKVPVHHAHHGNHGVWASSNPQKGYRDPSLGNSAGDRLWYSRPVIEVNKNDDLAMIFSRTGRGGDTTEYPSVRYSILYHNRIRFSHSQPVADGELQPFGDDGKPAFPWGSGVIDLGGAGVDPLGGMQVWLSHAYASMANSGYLGVITAVIP